MKTKQRRQPKNNVIFKPHDVGQYCALGLGYAAVISKIKKDLNNYFLH